MYKNKIYDIDLILKATPTLETWIGYICN